MGGFDDDQSPALAIQRVADDGFATYGVLLVDGIPLCATLEPSWRGNRKNESCIPAGRYRAIRHDSKRHGMTFRLKKVHGRSGIIFHAGNTAADTQGCILLGQQFAAMYGAQGIRSSRKAMDGFLHALAETNEAQLTIWEVIQ